MKRVIKYTRPSNYYTYTNYRTTEFLMLIPNNARNTIRLKQKTVGRTQRARLFFLELLFSLRFVLLFLVHSIHLSIFLFFFRLPLEPTNLHSIVIARIECSLIFINCHENEIISVGEEREKKSVPGCVYVCVCVQYKCVSVSLFILSAPQLVLQLFFCLCF